MLIAYNNDIEFRSRWYHIQTEDNGIKDGHITTTVFHSGQILDSKTTSYKEALAGVTNPEEQNKIIKEMMIKQHQLFYTKLYEGNYESMMQNFGQRPSASQVASIQKPASAVQKPVTSVQNPAVGAIHNAASSAAGASHLDTNLAGAKKPDILRASQQAPGVSRMGLKSLTNMTAKAPTGQVPVVHPSIVSSSRPASSSTDANREFTPAQPIVISKAVAAENAKRKSRAWSGVLWPNDDLAIDVLVVSLLDAN